MRDFALFRSEPGWAKRRAAAWRWMRGSRHRQKVKVFWRGSPDDGRRDLRSSAKLAGIPHRMWIDGSDF
jgi:hypothetical protein